MIASMVKTARGFRILVTAAFAALALTFTAGCIDASPPEDGEQQQEDGGGQQEDGGGEQEDD